MGSANVYRAPCQIVGATGCGRDQDPGGRGVDRQKILVADRSNRDGAGGGRSRDHDHFLPVRFAGGVCLVWPVWLVASERPDRARLDGDVGRYQLLFSVDRCLDQSCRTHITAT